MKWSIDKLKYILPNRPFGKTHKENRNARLVDVNAVISDINEVFAEVETELGNSYTKETVVFGPTELNAFSSTNKLVLKEAAGVGKFYNLEKLVFRLKAGPSSYNFSASTALHVFLNGGGAIYSSISTEIITLRDNAVAIVYPQGSRVLNVAGVDLATTSIGLENSTIELGLATTGTTCSGGDGTLYVDVYYRIEDI